MPGSHSAGGRPLARRSQEDDAAAVRQLWRMRLPKFLADASAEILGSPDVMAPINGGLWLAKPSRAAYDAATAMLQRKCVAPREP